MKNFAHFDRSTLPHDTDEGTISGVKGGKSRAQRERYERKEDDIQDSIVDNIESEADMIEEELYDQV